MKKREIISSVTILLLILIVPLASARTGIGISPGCYGTDSEGSCAFYEVSKSNPEEFEFHVYNFDAAEQKFTARIDGELANQINISPAEFTLPNYNDSVQHTGCIAGEGCQTIIVTLYTKKLDKSEYTSYLYVSTRGDESATINIVKELGAKLMISVKAPGYVLFYYDAKEFVTNNWIYVLSAILGISAVSILFIIKRSKSKTFYSGGNK